MSVTRRQFLTGSLSAAALASVGAACGSTTTGSNGAAAAPITFTTWYGAGDIPMWHKVISKYRERAGSSAVGFEPITYADYFTKLNTEFAGHSAPDVLGMQFQAGVYGAEGQLVALDDHLPAHKTAQIPTSLLTGGQGRVGGKLRQYALPWRFVGSTLFGNLGMMKAANIPFPSEEWTLDDLVKVAKKLTGGGRFGLQAPAGDEGANVATAFGARPVSADGKQATFDTPEMTDYYTFVHDLIFKHRVCPLPKTIPTTKDPFATGMVAMTFNGSWDFPVYRPIKSLDWDILPNPVGRDKPLNYAGPDLISIYGHSSHQQSAWNFVNFAVFTTEAQELISSTGLPVLTSYLLDQQRIKQEADQRPAHYSYFVHQAVTRGIGWAFVPAFAQIGTYQVNAEYKIYNDPNADVPSILRSLNSQVQSAMDKVSGS